jgi:hypothetical protein
MSDRLPTEPPDDFHPTIVAFDVDELFTAEIVIEVNLIPRLRQLRDTLASGLNPNRFGVAVEELPGAARIVIQEQDSSWGLPRGLFRQVGRY